MNETLRLVTRKFQFVDQRLTKEGLDRRTASGLVRTVPVGMAMRPSPAVGRPSTQSAEYLITVRIRAPDDTPGDVQESIALWASC